MTAGTAMQLTTSNRERICLACTEKRCCSYYTVTLTGRDVWRIALHLQLSPLDFVRYAPAEKAEGRFVLAPDGQFYELLLAKRPLPPPLPSPCVFLMRTNDAYGVCGLGALRPGQCRAYPVYLQNDRIGVINDPDGCVRTWSYGDIDLEEEDQPLRRLMGEEAEHRQIVREWNQRVHKRGQERTFQDFCTYLVNRYAALEGPR